MIGFVALIGVLVVEAREPQVKRNYRAEMRSFVQHISAHSRRANPGFIVVPQGGIGLVTDNGRPDGQPFADYLRVIDGVGQEEIFYGYENKDNRPTPPRETAYFLKQLGVVQSAGKPVLSIDYASKPKLIDAAYARNAAAGFIPFVADRRGLDRIPVYPERPVNEHSANVTSLKDARNFLYLIDGGRFGTKEKYLAALAKTNYDLLVIDLLAGAWSATPSDVKLLQKRANGARRLVLCYVSIGQAEDYRFYWNKDWQRSKPAFLGPEDADWKGNYAVRYWDPAWQKIFLDGANSYVARVLAAGFDGIYLDKVDEYEWFEEHGEWG
jgi:cysteinyl-tRNA synthetase